MDRAHVAHDIIPYSCIVDDCETPDEMYLTAENLLGHMFEKDSVIRWTCDYCAYGSNDCKESTAQEWESLIAAEPGDIIPVS
jgi:hypothetical protein